MTLSEYEIGFIDGALAQRGISAPTDDDMRYAIELLAQVRAGIAARRANARRDLQPLHRAPGSKSDP